MKKGGVVLPCCLQSTARRPMTAWNLYQKLKDKSKAVHRAVNITMQNHEETGNYRSNSYKKNNCR